MPGRPRAPTNRTCAQQAGPACLYITLGPAGTSRCRPSAASSLLVRPVACGAPVLTTASVLCCWRMSTAAQAAMATRGPATHAPKTAAPSSPYPPAGKMLQYAYLSLTILVALPLTLPIDGTDWVAQFGGWSGGDWAWLVCGGTVVYGEAFRHSVLGFWVSWVEGRRRRCAAAGAATAAFGCGRRSCRAQRWGAPPNCRPVCLCAALNPAPVCSSPFCAPSIRAVGQNYLLQARLPPCCPGLGCAW